MVFLQGKFAIKEIGVFGSLIKEEQTEFSDVDILIVFSEGGETFKNYMKLKFFLEDSLGRQVDLVIRDTLKEDIKDRVLRDVVYV
ncbi:MAG: nucleotidyltransferase family protein [Candidatus Hodarchaeota archaeon]